MYLKSNLSPDVHFDVKEIHPKLASDNCAFTQCSTIFYTLDILFSFLSYLCVYNNVKEADMPPRPYKCSFLVEYAEKEFSLPFIIIMAGAWPAVLKVKVYV